MGVQPVEYYGSAQGGGWGGGEGEIDGRVIESLVGNG